MPGPISPSLEDYLEAILAVADPKEGARTTDIAAKLQVSKASVNQAMSLLADHGLVQQEKYGPVYLTKQGHTKACLVYRRHQAIKSFLVAVLGVSEDTAEEDACKIEHVLSKESMDCLLDFMARKDNDS
ncbi:MAG: metal-dependent transcriptional regulator [Limnochordia bacterium]|jgi:DtxR family Mn-dependent transcriptional regulator|nr:metal-dependent transcriptional regulator [Limnochordia bacterium]MDD4517124.1 metal-dependent transcriptional regulator [Limnochordia bacterium]